MTLIEALKRDEGFRSEAYPDPLTGGAPWTIGYGETMGVQPGDTVTEPEAAIWLEQRVSSLRAQLSQSLPWFPSLTPERQDVLLNMAYNMGVTGLLKFNHTLDAVSRGLYHEAASHMLQSLWAKQVPSRAERLANQMITGVEQ